MATCAVPDTELLRFGLASRYALKPTTEVRFSLYRHKRSPAGVSRRPRPAPPTCSETLIDEDEREELSENPSDELAAPVDRATLVAELVRVEDFVAIAYE